MEKIDSLVWKDEYNIGVDSIDSEHQRLFRIINRLFAAREGDERESQWVCQEGVKYFQGHALSHFLDEENYMLSINYADFDRHRRIHKGFRENTIPALEQELRRTGYAPDSMDHFLGVCAGWLVAHTQLEDRAIAGENASPWKQLLPDGEVDALKKVITQLVYDMFRLKPQVISDTYAGEKFGEGVYYRLVYGNRDEDKVQEVLMVFEEKLLLNTVGRTLGVLSEQLDAMLVNASRYTVQQLVGRILGHFPAMQDYELKEENLLSYEEFQEVFERKAPQASLLFNTRGAGYFSFCLLAPQVLRKGAGTPIVHENAMAEVGKFLTNRLEELQRENPKQKILIVDDSLTIREGFRLLLEEEYEVALAESGIAAIRSITLNRPDLVLLDYDMPVCDGRQTLEMLRSEKEFENLPVMFLTGRRDRESMVSVMPLKPQGYLLKDNKPSEIKKEIDRFLQRK